MGYFSQGGQRRRLQGTIPEQRPKWQEGASYAKTTERALQAEKIANANEGPENDFGILRNTKERMLKTS